MIRVWLAFCVLLWIVYFDSMQLFLDDVMFERKFKIVYTSTSNEEGVWKLNNNNHSCTLDILSSSYFLKGIYR